MGQRKKNRTGLSQRELCDRLLLNYKVVALSAKQLGLSTHEYLQKETGWYLANERYYPSLSDDTSANA